MENYALHSKEAVIGKGSYGVVLRVRPVKGLGDFALKCHRSNHLDATVRELSVLSALKGHPNIIEILDCFTDQQDRIAMLMAYVPYTLWHAIYDARAPLSFVASLSIQIANALAYMHGLNLIHRDLSPRNVLLTEDLTVKVADMGLARHSSKRMSLCVVTEPYSAPELFCSGQSGEYTCAVDMWSLGVIVLNAMEAKLLFLPHRGCSTYQVIESLTYCNAPEPMEQVTKNREAMLPNVMKCEPAKRVAFWLLAFNQAERLTAHELLQDAEWERLSHMSEEERAAVLKRCAEQCNALSAAGNDAECRIDQ